VADSFYDEHHRELQDRFESRALADSLEAMIVQPQLDGPAAEFISSREFFFLSTVTTDGQPTVSHKGGAPGFVKVLDPQTLAFPSFDGNGMFFSMGNITATAKIGMLFIDFETPHRVRVHADATVDPDDALLVDFPGAQLVVRASITDTFVNCPRYIVKHERVEASRYVPDMNGDAPSPAWKKIDGMAALLPSADAAKVMAEGETISVEEYADRVARGDG
jgi:predicted pyridoxine 5'-phosphate oxidase superfamily flavin-nucleotide-binding protein